MPPAKLLKCLPLGLVFLGLCPSHLPAGDGVKTTVQATVDASPHAQDTAPVMIQTAVLPAKTEEKPIAPPPPRCAADWVAAWEAAQKACPEGTRVKIYVADRPGLALESPMVFECVALKARGELLVLTCKPPGQKDETVTILRAGDLVRMDVAKPAARGP